MKVLDFYISHIKN